MGRREVGQVIAATDVSIQQCVLTRSKARSCWSKSCMVPHCDMAEGYMIGSLQTQEMYGILADIDCHHTALKLHTFLF